METNSTEASFVQELDKALHHLYDPGALRSSALLHWFGVRGQAATTMELQHILTDAIETLRPDEDTPLDAKAWRIYHILCYRFKEQCSQRQVAADLFMSVRQLRRYEKTALQVLSDRLWEAYGAGKGGQLLDPSGARRAGQTRGRTPSRDQELNWLGRTIPSEMIQAHELIEAVLEVIRPLTEAARVSVYLHLPDLPVLSVQRTSVRQAFLYVLTAAIRFAVDGQIDIRAEVFPRQVRIEIEAVMVRVPPGPSEAPASGKNAENLALARELLQLSSGSLRAILNPGTPRPFTASIVLPTAEQITVLVIDDNRDTLQLLERYLSGTRYQPVGIPDPQEALVLAEQLNPDVILLDIMLPQIDGWELLGRLREHPVTRGTPVIVCTILSQEQLALTLGAADFVRKPVSRMALLSTLNRQMAQSVRGSRSRP